MSTLRQTHHHQLNIHLWRFLSLVVLSGVAILALTVGSVGPQVKRDRYDAQVRALEACLASGFTIGECTSELRLCP